MKKFIFLSIITFLVFSGCTEQLSPKQEKREDTSSARQEVDPKKEDTPAGIANPASVNCKEKGYQLEIRTGADGGQIGYCLNKGKECEEWAFYRSECMLE